MGEQGSRSLMPHQAQPGDERFPLFSSCGVYGFSSSTLTKPSRDGAQQPVYQQDDSCCVLPTTQMRGFSKKRATIWTGDNVHVTERCDEATAHLVTDVHTTPATTSDFEMIPFIQATLAQQETLPHEHFVDAGYVTTSHLITSRVLHDVSLIGPLAPDPSWQAQPEAGFESANFRIDWRTADKNRNLSSRTTTLSVDATHRPTPTRDHPYQICDASLLGVSCARSVYPFSEGATKSDDTEGLRLPGGTRSSTPAKNTGI